MQQQESEVLEIVTLPAVSAAPLTAEELQQVSEAGLALTE